MAQTLTVLSDRFEPPERFRPNAIAGYQLLPLRFIQLDSDRYVMSNLVGEHVVTTRDLMHRFLRHELWPGETFYDELKGKHFLVDTDSSVALDLLAAKYRAKQSFLSRFTSLFMFVTTLRCDHSCPYCQVSRQSEDKAAFDMTPAMADRAIDLMYRSPSPQLKVEFQGGESLLNFEIIRYIVERVEARTLAVHRDVEFVIATNLSPLTDGHLDYCREHRIAISTSLDGPRELHNKNRPKQGGDSFERTIRGIDRCRKVLGEDRVSALMTTTPLSLTMPEAIVDEYVARGFRSIFLRSLSPYGFAASSGMAGRYQVREWLAFYKSALGHILALNQRGTSIREELSHIVLAKLLTPYATGYVDLQSPAGLGISAIVFNYDGEVYASDEARMLAEMGDRSFRLGNLFADSFESIMGSDRLRELLLATMTEGMPMCTDCGLLPYCGSDPVRHHRLQGDPVGFKPTSDHCQRHMEVIKHLIRLLQDDEEAAMILRTWVSSSGMGA